MKKYLTAMFMAVLIFTVAAPLKASAEQNPLQLTANDKEVTVSMTPPNAGEKISSLRVQLEITPALSEENSVTFTFDGAVTGKSSVCEFRYHPEREGALNIYISGTEPLSPDGSPLTLGKVNLAKSGCTVKTTYVATVRGTEEVKLYPLDDNPEEPSPAEPSGSPSNPGIVTGTPDPTQTPGVTEGPNDTPTPTPSTPAQPEKLKAPKLPKLANVKAGIRVSWTKVSNASGYYVYRKTANGTWKKIATVKGNRKVTYTDKSVKNKNGVRYFYSIQAYNGKNTSAYNKNGARIVRMISQGLSKPASKGSGTVLVKWKQNKKAAGYQIEYSTSKQLKNSKIVRIKSGKKTSRTLKGLKKGKTYYFRVRSYQKVGKTTYTSAWSAKKKVKVK